MSMTEAHAFKPTILLPEMYFPDVNKVGFLADKIEQIVEDGFYTGVEIPGIANPFDRERIKNATTSANLTVVQWMTALINEQHLDISAINSSERSHATEQIKKNISSAVETGAEHIALITGPNPKEKQQEKAAEALYKSLCDICSHANDFGIEVLLEPLDRLVHKKRFIGPTKKAVEIIGRVKQFHDNIGLAFDTAHAALNSETMEDSLYVARQDIGQLHLSNAVLNPGHQLYGDYHIPLGAPGFMTFKRATNLLKKAKEINILDQIELRVSVEVRSSDNNDAKLQASNAEMFLRQLQDAICIL